ncbi:hypothetical protein BDZ45DRAFT_673090 [Acephala macrosclerotiorum]|nr:hypothetical protein BDZ45DRAFT_673090 [Acephala macrosclerotiorum]
MIKDVEAFRVFEEWLHIPASGAGECRGVFEELAWSNDAVDRVQFLSFSESAALRVFSKLHSYIRHDSESPRKISQTSRATITRFLSNATPNGTDTRP